MARSAFFTRADMAAAFCGPLLSKCLRVLGFGFGALSMYMVTESGRKIYA